jgi:hypothetical protein
MPQLQWRVQPDCGRGILMSAFYMERLIKLHLVDAHLEVGIDPDTCTCVEIRTTDQAARKYFGQINLTLTKAQALQLADAIRSVAEQLP